MSSPASEGPAAAASAAAAGQSSAGKAADSGIGGVSGSDVAGASSAHEATAGSGAAASSGTSGAGSPAQNGSAGQFSASGRAGIGGSISATTECPETILKPGETTATVQVGGVARTFLLYVPSSYTGKQPVPFVTDWHPLMAYGAAEKAMSGYKAKADQKGFIIAWPNAIEGGWNIGPCCTSSGTVDDLGFAKAIVADVKSRACIDAKRVFATGISMGGGMSHYLACNAADVFAAVAPAAFDLLIEQEEPCHPSRPITVISFRGTADPVVPFAGGASRPPSGLDVTIHFLGAEGTFEKWSKLNECTGEPVDTGDGCKAYTQCKAGVEVTLCTQQGGGHSAGDPELGWQMTNNHPMP